MKCLTPIAAAALVLAGAAHAHPLPKDASPAPNAVLAASPTSIRITFSEGLVGRFSGLEIVDQAGRKADAAAATVDPSNPKILVATLRGPLAPGAWTVAWHAVGDDTHRTSGRYGFKILPGR
jgi:methionine-rich copper-binding protein CopC